MEALLMFNDLVVKSYKKEYTVKYVDAIGAETLQPLSNEFLVIDENINHLYPHIREYFDESKTYVFKAHEGSKTLKFCTQLLNFLVENNFKRNNKLIAVGGGITQDVVGFTSSVMYRGVDWIFFPTTLLAQADSCIGSKTSINFNGAKNLIGTFHPPLEIFCCVEFLNTLPQKDIKSGIGEVLHYYLIDDYNKAIDMMGEYDNIVKGDFSLMKKHIKQSLEIKKKIIEIDEFDQKIRKVFNYGHTFGHAIEALTDYSISHGQAVTLGMDLANYVSYNLGYIDETLFVKMHNILKRNIPEYAVEEGDLDKYIGLLMKDKKNINNSVGCILLKEENKAEITYIDDLDRLRLLIKEYFRYEK